MEGVSCLFLLPFRYLHLSSISLILIPFKFPRVSISLTLLLMPSFCPFFPFFLFFFYLFTPFDQCPDFLHALCSRYLTYFFAIRVFALALCIRLQLPIYFVCYAYYLCSPMLYTRSYL